MGGLDVVLGRGSNQKGYTIVEVVVTLMILGVFLAGFFQAFLLLESQRVSIAREATASDIAYSNLRKFTDRPTGVSCSASGTSLVFTHETDGSLYTESVKAYPVNGCDGSDFKDGIVRIESVVEYNNGNGKVVHATFVQ